MTKEELKTFLKNKPGYLKCGPHKLSRLFSVPVSLAEQALKEAKATSKPIEQVTKIIDLSNEEALFLEFLKWKEERVPFKKDMEILPEPFLTGDPNNVLVIGDLHEPFSLNEYLHFCRDIQERDNCGSVVFIGDIIDNHYTSYHESETSTYGPNQEFQIAKNRVQRWYKVFPTAYVTIGNHDRIVHRKAKSAGIADKWVMDFSTALNTPGWKFVEEVTINGVCYNHGEGGTASTRMRTELQSQVQGHLHSQFYIQYGVGSAHRVFGMQVGCGIDRKAFAFAYGKHGPKPVIGCGTVLEKGTLPRLYPMNI